MKLYDYTHNKSGAKGTWNDDQYQAIKGRDWLGKYTVVERVVRGEGQQFVPDAIKRLQLQTNNVVNTDAFKSFPTTDELNVSKKKKTKPNA